MASNLRQIAVVGPGPKALLAEKARRERIPAIVNAALAELFPQQRAFAEDPAKRKSCHTGRRGGKSASIPAVALRDAAAQPGSTFLVIETNLESEAAKETWKYFHQFEARHKVGWKVHETFKRLQLPAPYKNTFIEFRGADTLEGANNIRGGKFSGAVIDEAASFRDHVLDSLVNDVLEAALMDYNGALYMVGSPGVQLSGTFYKACHGKHWSTHHWDMLDNHYLPLGKDVVGEEARLAWRHAYMMGVAERNSWDPAKTPRFLREWRGLWVASAADQMYAFDRNRNLMPSGAIAYDADTWRVVLGCDVGNVAHSAFVVLGVRENDPHIYVLESFQKPGLIPSTWAAEIEKLRERYSFAEIVVDTGGLGKGYVEEGKQTFGLPLIAAQKRHKASYVRYCSGDLASGRLKILANNAELASDLEILPWNEDETDAAPNFDDHLADALLYAHRHLCAPAQGLGERDAPKRGSDEWFAAEEKRMLEWAEFQERLLQEGRDPWAL